MRTEGRVYLRLTPFSFCALSIRPRLSQLCEFGTFGLDLCPPLVGHGVKKRDRGKLE